MDKSLLQSVGLMFLCSFVATPAAARSKGQQTFLAEISPLRTALGAPEIRLESSGESFGAALVWNQEHKVSERSDYSDQSQAFRLEALWYPLSVSRLPFFLGGGLQYEDALIGRQEERSHVTWARTEAGEINDEWINHDAYWSLTQSAGYRWFAKSLLTASISAFRDELVSSHSRNKNTGKIYSSTLDLTSRGRRSLRTGVMLQVGIFLR